MSLNSLPLSAPLYLFAVLGGCRQPLSRRCRPIGHPAVVHARHIASGTLGRFYSMRERALLRQMCMGPRCRPTTDLKPCFKTPLVGGPASIPITLRRTAGPTGSRPAGLLPAPAPCAGHLFLRPRLVHMQEGERLAPRSGRTSAALSLLQPGHAVWRRRRTRTHRTRPPGRSRCRCRSPVPILARRRSTRTSAAPGVRTTRAGRLRLRAFAGARLWRRSASPRPPPPVARAAPQLLPPAWSGALMRERGSVTWLCARRRRIPGCRPRPDRGRRCAPAPRWRSASRSPRPARRTSCACAPSGPPA